MEFSRGEREALPAFLCLPELDKIDKYRNSNIIGEKKPGQDGLKLGRIDKNRSEKLGERSKSAGENPALRKTED